MKISCRRDEFVQRLGVVSRALSTRGSVQILSGILLRAEGDEVAVAATDMQLSLRAALPAQVEGEGAVVLPGRTLVEIARLLPDAEVSLEYRADESVVQLLCGAANYALHTYSVEDFPRLPDVDVAAMFAVEREALLETVARVARSASRDESRPVLTGILARFEPGKLVMAASDAYRLAVKETSLEDSDKELEAIIPARALHELSRIAQSADAIRVGIHENQVVFAADDLWLTTRRIDGQFPNYKQLIPETFEHELTLPRAELLDVVRRVAVLVQRHAPLELHFAEGELTVLARSTEVGEAREALPAPYAREPLAIGFNADFLREGLESVTSDDVRVKLISPLRPVVLQGEDEDFSYLVMPIRLPG